MIKKTNACFVILGLFILLLFSSCKGKDTRYSSVYEKQQATYMEQYDNYTNLSKNVIPKTIGIIIVGFIVGGALGFVLSIVIDDCCIIEDYSKIIITVLVAIVGALVSFFLFYSKVAEEYINIETSFVFSQHDGNEIRTLIYGSADNEDASKHFLPRFSTEQEVQLSIEMNTSMLKNKTKRIKKFQRSVDILIPVEITISKTDNVSYLYDGGIQKDQYSSSVVSKNDMSYKFFIKNNPELKPNIRFLFNPSDVGEVEVKVVYGTPEYKMTDSICDVSQTIKFIEN